MTLTGSTAELQSSERFDLIYSYYRRGCDNCVNKNVLEISVKATEEAASMLCLTPQVDTMLSMWIRESNFDPGSNDENLVGHKRRSLGVSQVRHAYIPRLRREWKKLGVNLGSFSDPRTQVFLGVLEFKEHLGYAKGDVFQAVRRYNGSGGKAYKYARNVFFTRRNVLKHPYIKNEYLKPKDCK